MLVRHFKNHSPTPKKYVRVKLPTLGNGGSTQLVPLEIVGFSDFQEVKESILSNYAMKLCFYIFGLW